ncbi:MAG: HNH endonuclease family protein, partial [uncultured Solirubrobacterales bacterium]
GDRSRGRARATRRAGRRTTGTALGDGQPSPRAQRVVRADQRLHGPARRGPHPQGSRRDPRARRPGPARRDLHPPPSGGHPADQLRTDSPRRARPAHHPARGLRARPLDVPVLRDGPQQLDRRPRDSALQGRALLVGQHRRLLRALQPAQGRPPARPDRHAPARAPTRPERDDLRPRGHAEHPADVGAVPGGL